MSEGRYEFKYIVSREMREALLAFIAPFVVPDGSAGPLTGMLPGFVGPGGQTPRGYAVHSLYLDSARLHGYGERLAEQRIRNRIRIRTYGEAGTSAPVFLEAKRKLAIEVIKHRVRVGPVHAWEQLTGPTPWIAAVARCPEPSRRMAERWLAPVLAEDMRAVVGIHYVRETYVDGETRLTLDHYLKATACPRPNLISAPGEELLIPEDQIVLELKFKGAAPLWVRQTVARFRLCAEPVSKFALGVARTLRAEHPAELRYLTPPSLLRTGRALPPPARGAAR